MSVTITKESILNNIDKLIGYNEKLEYLNKCYLETESVCLENEILVMIEQLKQWGA